MNRIDETRPPRAATQATSERPATETPPAPLAVPWPKTANIGAVVAPQTSPVEALAHLLSQAERRIQRLAASPLPENVPALIECYLDLGWAQANCEAAMLGALDALDPRTGGGTAQPEGAYQAMRQRSFAALAKIGESFDRIEPAFARLVHGGAAWPPQPELVNADRGDGRPLYHYRNSFKRQPGLSSEERRAEYDNRVAAFLAKGGRFDQIITATPGIFDQLASGVRYDYVMAADGTLRMYPNPVRDDGDVAKPGHSLLAVGGPTYVDAPVLLAGEIWVYRDSAGDTECVVVANNSGHFKPTFADLPNALPHLKRLGLPAELVVLFGGPNNLPSMLAEISHLCGVADASDGLPPPAAELLAAVVARVPPRAAHAR